MQTQKYDDVLGPFLTLMRRELHANCGKGDRPGWLAMSANEGLLEVYYHLAKLQKAVKHNDGPAIMEYSADVANMAMMVLDICGGLAWVEMPGESAGAVPSDKKYLPAASLPVSAPAGVRMLTQEELYAALPTPRELGEYVGCHNVAFTWDAWNSYLRAIQRRFAEVNGLKLAAMSATTKEN